MFEYVVKVGPLRKTKVLWSVNPLWLEFIPKWLEYYYYSANMPHIFFSCLTVKLWGAYITKLYFWIRIVQNLCYKQHLLVWHTSYAQNIYNSKVWSSYGYDKNSCNKNKIKKKFLVFFCQGKRLDSGHQSSLIMTQCANYLFYTM